MLEDFSANVLKEYANDIENEQVNVESMCLFLTNVFHALNIWFLHPKNLF